MLPQREICWIPALLCSRKHQIVCRSPIKLSGLNGEKSLLISLCRKRGENELPLHPRPDELCIGYQWKPIKLYLYKSWSRPVVTPGTRLLHSVMNVGLEMETGARRWNLGFHIIMQGVGVEMGSKKRLCCCVVSSFSVLAGRSEVEQCMQC